MLNQKSLSGTLPRKDAFILFLLTLKNSVFPMPNMISLWSYRPLIHYLTSSPPHSPNQSDIREFRMSQNREKYLKKGKPPGEKFIKQYHVKTFHTHAWFTNRWRHHKLHSFIRWRWSRFTVDHLCLFVLTFWFQVIDEIQNPCFKSYLAYFEIFASNISSKSSFEDNEKVNSGITAQGPSKRETATVQIVSFYLTFIFWWHK